MSCDTCRSGAAGEDTYTAFHVDGRLYCFCRDCDRRVSDPHEFAEENYTANQFAIEGGAR